MTAPDPDPADPAHPDPGGPDTARPGGTGSDAEQHDAGGARRPGLPEDVDAAFAAIVADWAAEGAPRWPDDAPQVPGGPDDGRDEGPSSGAGTATPPSGRPTPPEVPGRQAPRPGVGPRIDPPVPDARRNPPARPADDEHFVPPDPPPLPRLGLSSLLGLGLLIIGVVLLAVPGLLGAPLGPGIVPGLLAMTAGLGWLVFGMRRGRGSDDGTDDDGARL